MLRKNDKDKEKSIFLSSERLLDFHLSECSFTQ
jgi:hypothetical protein